jgi:hypothetical protein
MKDEIHELPVIIQEPNMALYGLLRLPEICTKIIIFVPWGFGDRTGMARIYVEAARILYDTRIASLCVDLPPNNYSYDTSLETEKNELRDQADHIEKFVTYIEKHYPHLEITVAGYCSSAIATIYVARKRKLAKVIAINPWDFQFFELTQQPHDAFFDYSKYYSHKLRICYILAEHEEAGQRKLNYLKKYFEDDNCMISTKTIPKADHLFCGWHIKEKVSETLKSEMLS